ncbi:hypothetical protein PAPYR_2733 [Paratrimastix pyriformis]|uniref:Uncharacterized protein n=1 Tax=Paratrimastix pyriformis TaxID=342808 RepID=A0ABQ8UU49_9EUKA|nr:hypothetical protein PAPYR_2733 [Paratrimastix pyriformis]
MTQWTVHSGGSIICFGRKTVKIDTLSLPVDNANCSLGGNRKLQTALISPVPPISEPSSLNLTPTPMPPNAADNQMTLTLEAPGQPPKLFSVLRTDIPPSIEAFLELLGAQIGNGVAGVAYPSPKQGLQVLSSDTELQAFIGSAPSTVRLQLILHPIPSKAKAAGAQIARPKATPDKQHTITTTPPRSAGAAASPPAPAPAPAVIPQANSAEAAEEKKKKKKKKKKPAADQPPTATVTATVTAGNAPPARGSPPTAGRTSATFSFRLGRGPYTLPVVWTEAALAATAARLDPDGTIRRVLAQGMDRERAASAWHFRALGMPPESTAAAEENKYTDLMRNPDVSLHLVLGRAELEPAPLVAHFGTMSTKVDLTGVELVFWARAVELCTDPTSLLRAGFAAAWVSVLGHPLLTADPDAGVYVLSAPLTLGATMQRLGQNPGLLIKDLVRVGAVAPLVRLARAEAIARNPFGAKYLYALVASLSEEPGVLATLFEQGLVDALGACVRDPGFEKLPADSVDAISTAIQALSASFEAGPLFQRAGIAPRLPALLANRRLVNPSTILGQMTLTHLLAGIAHLAIHEGCRAALAPAVEPLLDLLGLPALMEDERLCQSAYRALVNLCRDNPATAIQCAHRGALRRLAEAFRCPLASRSPDAAGALLLATQMFCEYAPPAQSELARLGVVDSIAKLMDNRPMMADALLVSRVLTTVSFLVVEPPNSVNRDLLLARGAATLFRTIQASPAGQDSTVRAQLASLCSAFFAH